MHHKPIDLRNIRSQRTRRKVRMAAGLGLIRLDSARQFLDIAFG